MGRSLAAWAMAMSEGTVTGVPRSEARMAIRHLLSVPGAVEDAGCVCTGRSDQVVRRNTSYLRDTLGHAADIRGLVTRAAVRHGREVRAVGFDQRSIQR